MREVEDAHCDLIREDTKILMVKSGGDWVRFGERK
jgi:hypothetical protein